MVAAPVTDIGATNTSVTGTEIVPVSVSPSWIFEWVCARRGYSAAAGRHPDPDYPVSFPVSLFPAG